VYGLTALVSSWGGKAEIRLRPSLLTGEHPHMRSEQSFQEGRFLFVADVLLHEMVHQYHMEITGQMEDDYHGHGPEFRDVANRIGADLGLPPVRMSKKRGPDKDLPSCAQWPHCVRPSEYYLGAYIDPQREREKEPPIVDPPPQVDDTAALLARIRKALMHVQGAKESLDELLGETEEDSTQGMMAALALTDLLKAEECLTVPTSGDTESENQ
jgi:hypothetical protein